MTPGAVELKPIFTDVEAEILVARNAFMKRGAKIAAHRPAERGAVEQCGEASRAPGHVPRG